MRVWLRPEERRPDPPVVRTDDRKVVLAGTGVWLVALGVCLLRYERLLAGGDGWWVWVCVAGVVLGLVGLVHVHRQHVRRPRPAVPGQEAPTPSSVRTSGD